MARRKLPDTRTGRRLSQSTKACPKCGRTANCRCRKLGHEEREHAPLAPSASSRWLKCLPSPEYIRRLIATGNIRKRVSGPSAQRGTRIHEMSEPVIKSVVNGGAMTLQKGLGDPQESREAQAYIDYCVSRWEEAQALDKDARCWIETRSTVTEICWGSNDFAILAAKRLTLIDLKSGREPVDPRTPQLVIYAMGIIRENIDKMLAGMTPRQFVREVETVIWSPNADDGGPPERSHVYTIDEFMEIAVDTEEGINAASEYWEGDHSLQQLQKDLVAGDWCTWCDALGVCPKAGEKAREMSRDSFLPVAAGGKAIAPPDPQAMDPAQVGQVLDRAKMFFEWLDAVKMHALELAQKGTKVPGWKVVAKQTHRVMKTDVRPKDLAKRLGVKEVDVLCLPAILSPSKLEEKFGAKAKKLMPDLTFRPFAVTIAREGDRRPPLDSTKLSFQPIRHEEDE